MSRLYLPLLCALACACGRSPIVACTAHAVAGLEVTVQNEQTGETICDAAATAVDGSYSEVLVPLSCRYIGAFERPGTYIIQVESRGFRAGEIRDVRVVMGTGDCPHVQTVRALVRLVPQS